MRRLPTLPVLFLLLVIWGGFAVGAAIAKADSPAEVMEAARLEAVAFWEAQGYAPLCAATVSVDQDLHRPVAAAARWNVSAEGDNTDCRIAVSEWFLDDTFVFTPDRFARRRQLIDLWMVMAHEVGHELFGAGHTRTGIMSADVDGVPAPSEAIEWAMSLTPKPQQKRGT